MVVLVYTGVWVTIMSKLLWMKEILELLLSSVGWCGESIFYEADTRWWGDACGVTSDMTPAVTSARSEPKRIGRLQIIDYFRD